MTQPKTRCVNYECERRKTCATPKIKTQWIDKWSGGAHCSGFYPINKINKRVK